MVVRGGQKEESREEGYREIYLRPSSTLTHPRANYNT